MSYASVDDLEARFRPLTDDEKNKAEVLLGDASELINNAFEMQGREIRCSAEILKIVTCAMVKRALASKNDADFSNVSTTVGVFSESYTYANPDGSLYLKRSELKQLGLASGRIKSISVGEQECQS